MPWLCLADADRSVFGKPNPAKNRREVIKKYIEYGEQVYGTYGTYKDGRPNPSLQTLSCPLLGLFHGESCAKAFKRAIDAGIVKLKKAPPSGTDGVSPFRTLIENAMDQCPDEILDAPPPSATDESISKFMESERPPLRDLDELREAKAYAREPDVDPIQDQHYVSAA